MQYIITNNLIFINYIINGKHIWIVDYDDKSKNKNINKYSKK